jgi:hypothetical protein
MYAMAPAAPADPEVLRKIEVLLKYPKFEATTMLKEGMVRNPAPGQRCLGEVAYLFVA